ncbi:hypothetical protein EXE46_13970 [Halorubrum sp. GN11_10-6_MGM]|nr:hypothetical protein EXE46_13970 [Halorubrum sp. GN11_10-6_MGM]
MRLRCCEGRDSKGQPRSTNPSDARTAGSVATEDRSELWESSAAGALEVFAVDLPAAIYKRAAGVPEVFFVAPLTTIYK